VPSSDVSHLSELLEAAQNIRSFIREAKRDSFASDLVRHRAISGQIIRMAGLVKRISPEFQDNHSDVPWNDIVKIGDYLVRAPDRADPNIIWNHARKFIPKLILKISALTRSTE
jgi:uncharacterized protein with HEPN domain